MQSLAEILQCSRPLVFENPDGNFPYSQGGTCFIVDFYGRFYVLTAKHTLKSYSVSQVRVQYDPNSKEFIPLSAYYQIPIRNSNDFDQYDIAALEINNDTHTINKLKKYPFFQLLKMDKFLLFHESLTLAYRGYPMEHGLVDYDARTISRPALTGEAIYAGKAEMERCHQLEFINVDQIKSLNGISGSPLFVITKADNKHYNLPAFAGILIRGSKESSRGFFIENKAVINFLDMITNHSEEIEKRIFG